MSRQGTGKSATISKAFALTSNWSAILALSAVSVAAIQLKSSTGQAPKMQDARITVRYTDIRQSAGITFRQDSTQTDEKYYLETMGTGVGWIDYDQDRSEEHTSELQSHHDLVCRLLLEKKKNNKKQNTKKSTAKKNMQRENHSNQQAR